MLLSIRGATKSFGPTRALGGVDLEADAGEVHAILGENGAGKSTLMGVLGGAVALDAGQVLLGGQRYAPKGPGQARAAGVAMVHQELSLCPHLSVEENILLGREPGKLGFLDRRAMLAQATAALTAAASARHPFSLATLVRDLSPAERQLVEIARALSEEHCRVLILDEPTSSLGREDVLRLFDRIRAMKERGLLVLYISHFLEEVASIADRFTVLRDGRTVGTGLVKDVPIADLVAQMAGRSLAPVSARAASERGEVVLSVEGLNGAEKPTTASFEVRRGEVLGVAGLVGSGRTELLRAIFGLDPVVRGRVRVGTDEGPASPARRLAQGVGLLSEDRTREGLALTMSIADNLTLSKLEGFGPAGFVLADRQAAAAARWIEVLHVRCTGPAQAVGELSGGNQQKVAVGRLLHHDVQLLLLDQPTRGIDVAAKADVHATIRDLAEKGKAIVLVSDDLKELLGACDRIAVMHKGVLGAARAASEWTEESLLAAAVSAQAGAA
jgi:ribose transport system ATP-binding protein